MEGRVLKPTPSTRRCKKAENGAFSLKIRLRPSMRPIYETVLNQFESTETQQSDE